MENQPESLVINTPVKNPLFEVTTISKILSAITFILLPFVGFFIGMNYSFEPVAVMPLPQPVDTQNEATGGTSAEKTIPENLTNSPESTNIEGIATTTVTAYVVALDPKNIVLDYVDIFTSDEAVQKRIEDGICSSVDTCPSYYYDRNINPQLRTFVHAENLLIFTDRNARITIEEFTPYQAFTTTLNGKETRHGGLFEVTLNDRNVVTKLQGIFRP